MVGICLLFIGSMFNGESSINTFFFHQELFNPNQLSVTDNESLPSHL